MYASINQKINTKNAYLSTWSGRGIAPSRPSAAVTRAASSCSRRLWLPWRGGCGWRC